MDTVANCAQPGEVTWLAAAALIGIFGAVAATGWAIVNGVTNSKK